MFVSHFVHCQCAHAVPGSNHVIGYITQAEPHTEAFSVTLVALLSFKKTINKKVLIFTYFPMLLKRVQEFLCIILNDDKWIVIIGLTFVSIFNIKTNLNKKKSIVSCGVRICLASVRQQA